MSKPQEILKAFQITIKAKNTEQIKLAQNFLASQEVDPNFIANLVMILQEPKIEYFYQKAAAVYLSKFAKSVIKTHNQQFINIAAQKILNILPNYKVASQHKLHICKALEIFITNDNNKVIRSAFQPNLIKMLQDAQKLPDDQVNFQYLAFFGQILMGNPGFSQEVFNFIGKTFINYINLILRIHSILQQALITQNGGVLSKILFILKQFTSLIKLYLKRFLFVDIQSNKLLFHDVLQTMITQGVDMNFPLNQLQTSVFYLSANITKDQKLINQIKSNYYGILNSILRILSSYLKEPGIIGVNPIFKKTSYYVTKFIEGSIHLMKRQEYYKIKNMSVLICLDQVYSVLITALRANHFYPIFLNFKQQIIEDLLFRALIFTPADYQNYYQESDQFINSLLHIIQRDVKIKIKKDGQQDEDQVQTFNSLKTYAAEFMNTFCKYQDGTLSQIMNHAFLILQGKLNTQFSPSLMLVVISILRDVSKQRKDLHIKISTTINKMLTEMELPKKKTEQPQNKDIRYSLVLVVLSKYFVYIQKVYPNISQVAFKLCFMILNDPQVQEVPKLICLDIIQVLNHLQQGETYAPQILQTLNRILANNENPSLKLFEAYFSLLKYNDAQLKKKSLNDIVIMINSFATRIKKQVESPNRQQILINKLWNVIRQVGQNQLFIPIMIQPIENAIMPLIPYIDGQCNLDFEQDILLLMTAFIQKSKNVTQNQLKMLDIIPKIFYNQYKANFGHSFQTLQVFILYGKNVLKQSPIAIESIINMCVTALTSKQYKGKQLSESDNCEGVLLLQSLIIGCGLFFKQNYWGEIADALIRKLKDQLYFNLLKSNLVACLALTLLYGYQYFDNERNDIILSQILNGVGYFSKVKHSPKILIVSLSQLMLRYENQFVGRRFVQIFDTIVTILQTISLKKDNLFDDNDDDEERDYANALITTKNQIVDMDQFQNFKKQILILKNKNPSILQETVGQIPQSKKDFLKNILAVQRVSNEPRQIFTIKRNK